MNITLKEVPPELHERLKQIAEETGRSLNRQIIYTLEQVLMPKCIDRSGLLQRIQQRRESLGGEVRMEELQESIERGRP